MRLSEVLLGAANGQEDVKGFLFHRPVWRESSKILGKSKKRNWILIKNGTPILLLEGKSSIKEKGKLLVDEIDADDWVKTPLLEAMGVEL